MKSSLIFKIAELGLDKTTGGRAVVAGHILSNNIDIFARSLLLKREAYKKLFVQKC